MYLSYFLQYIYIYNQVREWVVDATVSQIDHLVVKR